MLSIYFALRAQTYLAYMIRYIMLDFDIVNTKNASRRFQEDRKTEIAIDQQLLNGTLALTI